MRILLVEDDPMIGRGLTPALEKAGMVVDWVRTGSLAEVALGGGDHAIVLLDIGLPELSGLEVLTRLRRAGQDVPVLLITARDGVEDRVLGLDLGADDYLVKPFEVKELMARIRALTRRRSGAAQSRIEAGALTLDLASQELTYGTQCHLLPPREFALMRALMERPGTIFSRAQIEDRLYGWGTEVESNAVDVLIHSVRRKFDKSIIRNVRGAGWMILRQGS